MAVRKNRNYNKAHSINTIYLHITFKIQLALLLALCHMSPWYLIKDTICIHNKPPLSHFIQLLRWVSPICPIDRSGGWWQRMGRMTRMGQMTRMGPGAGHTHNRVYKVTTRQGQLSRINECARYSGQSQINYPKKAIMLFPRLMF